MASNDREESNGFPVAYRKKETLLCSTLQQAKNPVLPSPTTNVVLSSKK